MVLKNTVYSEYDGILELFTKQKGKISVMAKGIRRGTSKNKGACRVGSLVECEIFISPKENGMGKLKKITPLQCNFSEKIEEQALMAMVSEVSSQFLQPKYTNEAIFELWEKFISQSNIMEIHAQIFLCRFFTLLGIFPHFTCTTEQTFYYWNDTDGIVEKSYEEGRYKKISLSLYKLYKYFTYGDFSLSDKIAVSSSQQYEFWELFWWFYSHHSDYMPRSRRVWEEVRSY